MSFSSGAYLGSHSTVSQGRAASALVLALLVWIGPLSSTSTTAGSPEAALARSCGRGRREDQRSRPSAWKHW